MAGHVNIVYKAEAMHPAHMTKSHALLSTDIIQVLDSAAAVLLLHGNAGISSWSQQYTAAQYVAIGSLKESDWNMCAGYR